MGEKPSPLGEGFSMEELRGHPFKRGFVGSGLQSSNLLCNIAPWLVSQEKIDHLFLPSSRLPIGTQNDPLLNLPRPLLLEDYPIKKKKTIPIAQFPLVIPPHLSIQGLRHFTYRRSRHPFP